jgi:hypothetical protein
MAIPPERNTPLIKRMMGKSQQAAQVVEFFSPVGYYSKKSRVFSHCSGNDERSVPGFP